MEGGEGKRRRAATRVAHQVEAVEAASIGRAQDSLHFQIETEVRLRLIE